MHVHVILHAEAVFQIPADFIKTEKHGTKSSSFSTDWKMGKRIEKVDYWKEFEGRDVESEPTKELPYTAILFVYKSSPSAS